MSALRLRIRRSRRTDFTAVMQLLAAGGSPVPPPERATLRRFRHLVNDLGADFYLAVVDGTLAGLVHLTYARQLAAAPTARLEMLVVAETLRRCGVGTALLRFAQGRARQHGCATLACTVPESAAARRFLDTAGLTATGTCYTETLARQGLGP